MLKFGVKYCQVIRNTTPQNANRPTPTLYFHQFGSAEHSDSLALAGVPLVPVVGGEGDVVAVDDTVGTDVAHVAGGVEWREVGVLLLLRI